MARFVLDTDTCVYWLRGDRRIEKRILTTGLQNVFITIITECELFYGAYKSAKTEVNLQLLRELRRKVRTIQTTAEVAPLYGQIKADLTRAGRTLDDADLLIGAIALASKGTLVTNNTSHFDGIPGLAIENWK